MNHRSRSVAVDNLKISRLLFKISIYIMKTDTNQMSQGSNKNMSEIEKFKVVIPRVRDILRSCSITGMDSMRHICFYLLSRYITNDNVEELKIPKHLSWENIFIKAFEDEDIALELFKHDLIDQFDSLFKTQQFSFDMKNGVKHKEILEILNNISMKDIDLHMDILGFVYEQHLKTGSTAARDLGQFFTDRFICEYMVKLCQPKFKQGKIPESVCDPTMGTGGFLTAYLKHFKGENVDWSKYQNQIHGVDHDAKVAGVSRLNMFMESGGHMFKHLHTADSLHGGLNPSTYDIILANMPFGLKGLKYADVHSTIKSLGINGTKSEPLFLQLMMVSLNKGGRCAVVVPDGVLITDTKCHTGTRKYMFENFELQRVIKMKGKFFMNTKIQPSILLFENTGNKTSHVEFWEIERDDRGNVSETMVVDVPIEKFDADYTLQSDKYIVTDKTYNLNVETRSIGEIFNIEKGSLQSSKNTKGEYTFITASDDFKTHTTYTHEQECLLLVGGSEGSLAKCHYYNGKFIASDLLFILTLKKEYVGKIEYKYICYYLKHIRAEIIANNFICTGTTKRAINREKCQLIEVAFPVLKEQQKVIRQLEDVYKQHQEALKIIQTTENRAKTILGGYLGV